MIQVGIISKKILAELHNGRNVMKKGTVLLLCVVFLGSIGCSSMPLPIDTGPVGPDEQYLDSTFAQGTGILLFGFIPIRQNSRFERAYEKAVARVPGATRLTNVTIEEKWFWAFILNGYRYKLEGTAVGPK